ncbi:MAG: glycosyltransferase family 2 protein [Candidatus Hodarchaeota archaeon]
MSSSQEETKIGVIVRTRNSVKLVKNAVNSVLNQTLPKELCELVVVDDGSIDNTREVLRSYKDRIKVIEEKNLGHIRAANLGILHSGSEYVTLLDADDTFEPTILKEMLEVLENDKNIGFVYCDYYERNLETGEMRVVSLKDNIFDSVAGGIIFRKSILIEFGLYDESLVFPEYDLLIKIMKKYKGIHIPKPLFTYNRHPCSLTANKMLVKKGLKQLFDKYGEIRIRKY